MLPFLLMGRKKKKMSSSADTKRKKLDAVGGRKEAKKKKSTMSRASYDTFNGLNAVLESPRWPVDQVVLAVERCLEVNR